jgi:serine/threonine protein kinase
LKGTKPAQNNHFYRSPEFGTSTYNNKVDIWSLGCIFYELVMKKKAFTSNLDVQDYAHHLKRPALKLPARTGVESSEFMSSLGAAMLERDVKKQPSAKEIQFEINSNLWRWLAQKLSADKDTAGAIKAFKIDLQKTSHYPSIWEEFVSNSEQKVLFPRPCG